MCFLVVHHILMDCWFEVSQQVKHVFRTKIGQIREYVRLKLECPGLPATKPDQII